MGSSCCSRPEGGRFDPSGVRCVGIVAALHKRRVAEAVRAVVAWFEGRGIRALLPAEQAGALSLPQLSVEARELGRAADLLVAMGGDGTFLAASRMGAPHGKPILGVNLGGFGFLACVPQAGMLECLGEVMAGRLRVEERMMLAARVVRGEEEVGRFLALNDVVVGKGAFARLLRLRISISGNPVSDFHCDGVIIATPTGSTGYTLAAGGPVVTPEARVLIVTPICPHAVSARALVAPAGQVVEVGVPDPRGEQVILTADGQEGLPLRAGDRVEVGEAEFSAWLARPEEVSFYARLRSKLGWMRPR
jgi:NAD+ kinase